MRRTARHGTVAASLATVALVVAGCSAPVDRGGPDPGLRGQWELLSASDPGGTIPLANQLISLDINGDNSTRGRSTCADYTAHVYGSIANLWITATLPKAEHCGIQVQQDIEQRYITDLNQVRTSTVLGGLMDLRAPGIDLRFQRALLVPLTLVIGHTWKLATVSPDSYYATSNPTPVEQKGATLYFSKSGKLTGTTGCRRFTANYVENAGEVVASHFRSVAKHGVCEGEKQASDTYVVSVVLSGFTFLSGVGELAIASPRAEIALGFVT